MSKEHGRKAEAVKEHGDGRGRGHADMCKVILQSLVEEAKREVERLEAVAEEKRAQEAARRKRDGEADAIRAAEDARREAAQRAASERARADAHRRSVEFKAASVEKWFIALAAMRELRKAIEAGSVYPGWGRFQDDMGKFMTDFEWQFKELKNEALEVLSE